MDRALLGLAVVGLLAPALAGCVDASAFPFAGGPTTIHVPSLAHGQVTTSEAELLMIRTSPERSQADVEIFPVEMVQTVRDGVHADRDRYANPVEAVWIETETTAQAATPEQVPDSWVSRSAIETGGGHVLYHGVTSPRSVSLGGNSPYADPEFNEWCATRVEIPGGIPYYAPSPARYDRGSLYGTALTAGEDVVREYDMDLFLGDGMATAHVTVTWESVGQARLGVVVDGQARELSAIEYRVDRQYEYDGAPAPRDAEDAVDRRPRVWYADGIPEPVRTVSTFAFGDRTYTLERRVTQFVSGGDAMAVGGGEPAAQFDGPHPQASVSAWGFAPDMTGLGLAFPFEDAIDVLREDPRAVKARLWFEEHPDAVVESGEYARDVANGTFRWEFSFSGDGDVLYASVTRSAPPLPGVPRDEPHDIFVWDDHPFASRTDTVASLDVADAATALAVAQAFLPEPDAWYTFSFGFYGFYEEGEWRFGPMPYYSVANGGSDEKRDLFTHYEKEWRSPVLSLDGATAGLNGGGGAGVSCGGGGIGLPVLLTA